MEGIVALSDRRLPSVNTFKICMLADMQFVFRRLKGAYKYLWGVEEAAWIAISGDGRRAWLPLLIQASDLLYLLIRDQFLRPSIRRPLSPHDPL